MTATNEYIVAPRTLKHVVGDPTVTPCQWEYVRQYDVFYNNRRIASVATIEESDEVIFSHMAKHA